MILHGTRLSEPRSNPHGVSHLKAVNKKNKRRSINRVDGVGRVTCADAGL